MADEYVKVNRSAGDSELWKPEKKEDSLEGLYVDKRENVGSNNSMMYTIQKDDGQYISFWGTTVIDSNFANIPLGAQVKIVYVGDTTSEKTKRTFKNFDIFVKKATKKADNEEVNPNDIPF